MLVECKNCGAPLKVRPGDRFVTCRYCDRTNEIRSMRTMAMQAPPEWKPPPAWKPPEHVPEESSKELPYHQGVKHHVTRARNNKKSCSFVGCLVFLTGVVPFVVPLAMDTDVRSLFQNVTGGDTHPTLGTATLSPPGGSSSYQGTTSSSRVATDLGNPSCSGQIPYAPHVSLAVSEPTQLTATTRSTEDLTLALRHADGHVSCDDDSGDDRQPLLSAALAPGVHQLYVGTFAAGDASFELQLEWEALGAMPGPDGLAAAAPPVLGVLRAGDDAQNGSYVGETHGIVEASSVQAGCSGYLPVRPHLQITTDVPVHVDLVTESDVDTVMLVRAADGTTVCDDDSGGNRQPRVSTSLPAGQHVVWVGTFDQNGRAPFTLVATATTAGAKPGP